jgi:diguanylate cyclase (GGDEF)-like protein/PAS domain S-box-containing protein
MSKAKECFVKNGTSHNTTFDTANALTAVLNQVKIGFSIFDDQARLVDSNEHFVGLFNLPPDSAKPGTLLRTIQELAVKLFIADEQGRKQLLRKWRNELYSGVPSKGLLPLLDGRTICRSYCPLEQGGFITFYEDVTEEIERAIELKRTHALLDTVLENIPAAVMVKDAQDRRFSIVSREAGSLFGLNPSAMIGKTCAEILPVQAADELNSADDQALRSQDNGETTESWLDTGSHGFRNITAKRIVLRDGEENARFIVVVIHDQTELMETMRELERSRNFLNAVLEKIPIGIVAVELATSRFHFVNRAAARMVGKQDESFAGKTLREGLPQETADYVEPLLQDALHAYPKPWIRDIMFPWDDKLLPLEVEIVFLKDKNDKPQFYVVVVEDLTERIEKERELERSRNFLKVIVDNIPIAVGVVDLSTMQHLLVNRAAAAITGIAAESFIGKTNAEIHPKETADFYDAFMLEALRLHPEPLVVREVEIPTIDGQRIFRGRCIFLEDEKGKPRFYIAVGEDLTEEKRAAERIDFLAHHDSLTQLPNRIALNKELDRRIADAAAAGDSFALLSVDIDRFNELNDVFGLLIGDVVLTELAGRLAAIAEDVFVARSDGDQFTLLTQLGPQPATAMTLVQKIRDALQDNFEMGGHRLSVDASIGIAVFPTDGLDASTLAASADAALFDSKEDGHGTFRFFDTDMDRQIRARHEVLHDLRDGIDREEFVLHFQPQARIGGDIVGFEALVRWRHPRRGLIQPSEFIPIAEEYGNIIAIGEWTLRHACWEAATWTAPLQIAVNLSPAQFRDDGLVDRVFKVLADTGLNPSRLELEITERVLISDPLRAVSMLHQVKALGVKVVMDDFGTGYSSLSNLLCFPFDKIKIDRSFIMSLHTNPQAVTIVRAVLWMAHSLALPVTAEGIETKEQLAFLANESCDEVQGYLIGRPCPIIEYAWVTSAFFASRNKLLGNSHRVLTHREREILKLIAEGKSSKEVAAILGTSATTVEGQRATLMQKLGFHSIAELVRYAIREHIISP